MHAFVTHVQVRPGRFEEGATLWRESIIPALKQQQGFKAVALMRQPGTDKAMSVVLFESEADAQRAVGNPAVQQAFSKAMELLAGPPDRQVYEVALVDQL